MARAVALLALVLVLSSCASTTGSGDTAASSGAGSPSPEGSSTPPGSPSAPTSPRSAAPTERPGTVIATADSEYGPMLFDATGQAIYLFDKEVSRTPRCYGPCADAWPPVLTKGPPRGRRAVDESLLGTVRRRDGSTQVTYAGHPLYFYAHEGKREVLCHDVRGFGGLWLVVTPEGAPAPSG